MIEYYAMLVENFKFNTPHVTSGRARVYMRSGLGIWIGRRQPVYVAAAQPVVLSSEYDGRAIITRSTTKPFVWLTAERRLVVVEGRRHVYTTLKALLEKPLSGEETRWLDMGLRQDIGAMTGECARLPETVTLESHRA